MIQLISTSLDVQSLFRQIWDDEDDMYKTVSLFEVRNAIIQADGEIRSTLKDKIQQCFNCDTLGLCSSA